MARGNKKEKTVNKAVCAGCGCSLAGLSGVVTELTTGKVWCQIFCCLEVDVPKEAKAALAAAKAAAAKRVKAEEKKAAARSRTESVAKAQKPSGPKKKAGKKPGKKAVKKSSSAAKKR